MMDIKPLVTFVAFKLWMLVTDQHFSPFFSFYVTLSNSLPTRMSRGVLLKSLWIDVAQSDVRKEPSPKPLEEDFESIECVVNDPRVPHCEGTSSIAAEVALLKERIAAETSMLNDLRNEMLAPTFTRSCT